jgi:subtilisin family serine protease
MLGIPKKKLWAGAVSVLLLVTAGLGVQTAAYAQAGGNGAEPYVVIMVADPVIAYEGTMRDYKATKPGKGKKINPNSAHVKKYRGFLKNKHDQALASVGVNTALKTHDYSMALNGFAVQLTDSQVTNMAKQPGVLRVMRDEMRQKTTDSSPTFLGLTDAGGVWLRGLDGEGVVVGVIDTGIWPEHPSFADDGSYAAPPITLGSGSCDFGNEAHNANDAPFTCNNKLIGARQMLGTYRLLIGADADEFDSARDDDGHGSHTASTAAGNAGVDASMFGIDRGIISGIAPRAHVVAYKGLGDLGGFGSDLAAAIDQAVADGVDVINYSVGGGPSLTGADDLAYLFAADAGVFAATSAGNSGAGPDTVGGPGSVPWLTTVGANTQTRMFQGTAALGDGRMYSGASITHGAAEAPLVDAELAGDDLCNPGALDPAVVDGKIVLCRRGAIARAAKSLAVQMAGGTGMILYNNTDVDNLNSDNHAVPSIHIDNTPGLAIKSYIAGTGSPTASISCCELGVWESAPSMAVFSSRGPNGVAQDIIKPDITAPGHMILAGNSPFPDPGQVQGELFQAISGTSMSSPHIAGLFALIKQAHPDWTPAMAKSAIMTTASQDVVDNDRVTPAGPFAMGAGQADPRGKLNKGSIVEPGLVYDAGFLEYLGFLCDAEPDALSASTCPFLEANGIPTDASDLNLASIGIAELTGSQTIQRTVTSVVIESGWRTFRPSVDAPDGYDVTVSPSSLRLKRGQSATYQVTFTNDGSGTAGEWRTGSMTWRDDTGHHDVYSPIAVRGAMFQATPVVLGTGISGSASIDVKFGYTGAYTATPHGLVANSVVSGNVLQDPDQNFDPTDGFSNAHTFDLTGAVHARFALPPGSTEPDADLDMYVYDPSDVLVASSTSGGTDELIDIASPVDGVYTVYIHGWQAPGGDSDYDMDTWIADAPSSLVVDRAPASAVVGNLDTVDVSWTGLSAGTMYLGVVSHKDASSVLANTLISVDTN